MAEQQNRAQARGGNGQQSSSSTVSNAAAPGAMQSKGAGSGAPPPHFKSVRVDGQAVMKLIKHSRESMPSLATGQLLGLDVGSVLEVTNCFPFPNSGGEAVDDAEGAEYQLAMLRQLRDVNVDTEIVGWYQSTFMGSYHTEQLVDTFMSYAENIKRCVCIVYDPQRSQHGALALKALRLSDAFHDLYKSVDNLTTDKVQEKGLVWSDIFVEIPIQISNSTLSSSLMQCMAPASDEITQQDVDRLSLSTYPFLEKNMEFLVDCMEDLHREAVRQSWYQKEVQRRQVQQAWFIQRRRRENESRRAQGLEPLPEDDPANPIFNLPAEPSRLDELLVTNQVNSYCTQADRFARLSLEKLSVLEALHGSGKGEHGSPSDLLG